MPERVQQERITDKWHGVGERNLELSGTKRRRP